ncbi:MAG: phosphopentomutase [Ruminococcaceae bacterium]|nr:phosphopentomutase [Oscillospiraceae bacterium]
MGKRVFLIVLDSLGIGEMPDAALFGDAGSNTLRAIRSHEAFHCPNLEKMGLFSIEGVGMTTGGKASFARMREASMGKDTTVGHWEIAGIVSAKPLPTYPNGFPDEVIGKFEALTGKRVFCNRPYSGTEVLLDYGKQHEESGDLIVYTSADSVFQIAAHTDRVPVEELYGYCKVARKMLEGEHAVGRVIARPFEGEYPNYRRVYRHDFSLEPPRTTMLDFLTEHGLSTIAVGKIGDIFSMRGIGEHLPTDGNRRGMEITQKLAATRDFSGLCFVNLVDFDMLWGHRNDVEGYARGLSEFDAWLGGFLDTIGEDDVCIITADHGCDPSTPSTDHSREYTPMLIIGKTIRASVDLGTRNSFADIGSTVLDMFGIDSSEIAGESFYDAVKREEG